MFESDVLAFSDTAERLSKKFGLNICSRWDKIFRHAELTRHRGGFRGSWTYDPLMFPGEWLLGRRAWEAFSKHDPKDYFCIFEYQRHGAPTVFRCSGLHSDCLPPDGLDVAIVDFEAGWSIVFCHDDGTLTNGPCWYRV
jgi:hypothetical protein